jgi:hypothetical protein
VTQGVPTPAVPGFWLWCSPGSARVSQGRSSGEETESSAVGACLAPSDLEAARIPSGVTAEAAWWIDTGLRNGRQPIALQ